MIKKIIYGSLGLLFAISTACSSFQEVRNFDRLDTDKIVSENYGNIPSVVQIKVPKDTFVVRHAYEELPEHLNKEIHLSIRGYDVKKTIGYLSELSGINFILFETLEEKQENITKKNININYKGKLKDLLSVLSESSNLLFFYKNNSIIVKDYDIFLMSVPQYKELLKEIKDSIEKLGGKDVAFDELSSTLTFKADYKTLKRIEQYAQKLKKNSALITLRILIANVSLSNEKNMGIDWTKLAYGYGKLKGDFTQTDNQGDSDNSGTSTSNLSFERGISATFFKSGTTLILDMKRFSLAGVFNFMENYGKYNLMQNIFVETLSGKTGKIDVSTETPYIKNVAITPITTGTNTGSVATSTLSQTQSDVAKTGVVLEITPYYDATTKTLSFSLEVGVFGVTRFINLQAGQFGILSQPEITKKTVKTYLKMSTDQIAIIGGLIYDKLSSNVSGLPIDSYLTKTKQDTVEKEELVIIVKPTVVEFVSEEN